MRLTIGMPSYNNLEEVWFTVQVLRMYHRLDDCEILVIDNFGDPELEKFVKAQGRDVVRYEKCLGGRGPAYAKNMIFEKARGEMVMCIDSHILLIPGALNIPVTEDLLYGPLIYNDNKNYTCEWRPVWRGNMWGVWGDCIPAERLPKMPFEIWGSGSGCFATKRDSWLGFCSKYEGFGGEEGVLPEKYRKAGRKVLCQPNMIWQHMFERRKVPYPVNLIDRVHNYLVGFDEVGLDPKPIEEHFGEKIVKEALAKIAFNNRDRIIPKIVHQSWKDTNIPYDVFRKEWVDSWKMPGWEYKLWTDEDNRNLIKNHYPWFLETYDKYDKPIKRADAARYFIMQHEGGVYVDLDYHRVGDFESILKGVFCAMGIEYGYNFRHHKSPASNAMLISEKGHPFWPFLTKRLLETSKLNAVLEATGPTFLNSAVQEWQGPDSITLFKDPELFPWVYYDGRQPGPITKKTIGIHHSQVTWRHQ